MTRSLLGRGLIVLALTLAGAAQAQRSRYDNTVDNWPEELVKRPLTLFEGLTEIEVPVAFNLSTGSAGKPVFIPLQLAYGVTDSFTLAITHQIGLCLGGSSNGCAKVYNDIGLEGLFSLAPSGPFQAALAAGVLLPSITDPFTAAAVVGFDTRYGSGPVALRIDPRLQIGLNQRDGTPFSLTSPGSPPNREVLRIPVTLQLQATPNVAFSLGSGIVGAVNPPVGTFSDNYAVPLSIGAAYTTSQLDVGAALTFTNLRGPYGLSATALRIGEVFAAFRL